MGSTAVIETAPELATLELLVDQALGAKVLSAEKAGTGLIGFVSKVKIDKPPYEIIVKWQKWSGVAAPEARQLAEFRKHPITGIPEVFHVHLGSPEIPAEALIMSVVPGVQASSIPEPSLEIQHLIADNIIDILMQWHSITNKAGYGAFDGPYHHRWADYQRQEMQRIMATLNAREDRDTIPEIIFEMADRSREAVEDILGPMEGNAVLVHGDIWLPNILIDPSTYAVTGIVDPSMARWDEREMDVVPMDWPWAGDYQFLMKAYQKQCPLREGWELRFAFHRFWFFANAVFVIGPDTAKGEAENLKKLMDEQLKWG